MSRCARVWNILPKEVTKKNISIGRFKCELYKYYKSALNTYDARIQEHGSLYVCHVTRLAICLTQNNVVINFNVCMYVRFVKLHYKLISTQQSFPQEMPDKNLHFIFLYFCSVENFPHG